MRNDRENPRFDVTPTAESHFSWLRTRMSLERTLMATIRTAVALIGFGFTIVQFFEHLTRMPGAAPAVAPHAARYIGLSLIGAGTLLLSVSVWQYRKMTVYLRGSFAVLAGGAGAPRHLPALGAALALLLVGFAAFAAVLVRVP